MLFTNFLKENKILSDKENQQSNKQNRECIIQKKTQAVVSESTPEWGHHSSQTETESPMVGSTPLSPRQIPDIQHISQLLSMKKSKSPHKTYKSEMIQTQQIQKEQIKKQSTKLCLNCQSFITSKSIINHQKQCQGFQQLLSLSRHELLVRIISKILTNEIHLSELRETNMPRDSITHCQEKIAHLVKMKLRLQSKIALNK